MTLSPELSTAIATVHRALSSGRIGTPVAARLFIQITDPADQRDSLETAIDALLTWFDAPVVTSSGVPSASNQQISALLKFKGGESALVSIVSGMPAQPVVEVIVIGTHGIASWEPGEASDARSRDKASPRAPSDAARELSERLLNVDDAGDRQRSGGGSRDEETIGQQSPSHNRASLTAPREPAQVRSLGEAPWGVLLVSGDHTHQPGYAGALQADPRCRLVAVTDQADISADRLSWNQLFAHRLGIPYVPQLAEALAREDVDIVSVCAEPFRRGEVIVQSAEAGKHLYLDKPLCGSLEDADRIVAAVQRSGVVAHMFSQVFWPASQQARSTLEANELGELQAIHVDLCFAKGHAGTAKIGMPRRESSKPDRYEFPDAKRELTNVGVYNVCLMLWLLKRRAVQVVASTANYFFGEHQRQDMEDFGQIAIEFEGGLVASLTAGRTGWQSHPGGGLNRTYLVGSRKTAVIDTNRPRVEIWSDAPPWSAPDRDPEDPMGMWASDPDSPFRAAPRPSWSAMAAGSWSADTDHFLDCLENAPPKRSLRRACGGCDRNPASRVPLFRRESTGSASVTAMIRGTKANRPTLPIGNESVVVRRFGPASHSALATASPLDLSPCGTSHRSLTSVQMRGFARSHSNRASRYRRLIQVDHPFRRSTIRVDVSCDEMVVCDDSQGRQTRTLGRAFVPFVAGEPHA